MKTSFKAKYVQHLLQKKKGNEGFTLVELLVVVIIIGILAAIALPSFLNQTAKAKQSEAKNSLQSANSAQTTFRTEFSRFGSFTELSLGLPTQTQSYTYVDGNANNADFAEVDAQSRDGSIKPYAAATNRFTQVVTNPTTGVTSEDSVISSVICEDLQPIAAASGANPQAPATAITDPALAGPVGCPATALDIRGT